MRQRTFRNTRRRIIGMIERAVLNGAMRMALMAIERRLLQSQAPEGKSGDI